MFFTQSICTTPSGMTKTKIEYKPMPVDFQMALLMKKEIPFSVLNEQMVYEIQGVKVVHPFFKKR
jgi:hypothetical protein